MQKHEFGGAWTDEKLERVRKYLVEYTKIFFKNPRARKLTTYYVDAFAGTGYRAVARRDSAQKSLFPEMSEPDTQSLMKGSASIALEVEPGFKRYLFIESDPAYANSLRSLSAKYASKANRIEIIEEEANAYLKSWCLKTDWRFTRAVVFLDPYGMQVEWSLIETIARTRAIDLWLLFPLGVAVNRLLTKGEPPPEAWGEALTRIFGSTEWQEAFYPRKKIETFFGQKTICDRAADFGKISRFFVDRLKSVFTAVAENPLPLRNSKNVPLYLLCFAAGNSKGAPTALRIAQYILKE